MNDAELLALAVEMRQAQNDYYGKGRTQGQLAKAKELERRFDWEVSERRTRQRQPSLFGTLERSAGGPGVAT